MEEFIFIRPTKEYEQQAFDYIQEFKDYNSNINGVGGLRRYIGDYDGWLKHLEEDRSRTMDDDRVPGETFMLIRKSDNKLIGLANIRLRLDDHLLMYGGHIGYGIRPTERKKGYASYQLYCALNFCQEIGLERVLVTCDKNNLGSAKTIQNSFGVLENEVIDDNGEVLQRYWIDVNDAIQKLQAKYEHQKNL